MHQYSPWVLSSEPAGTEFLTMSPEKGVRTLTSGSRTCCAGEALCAEHHLMQKIVWGFRPSYGDVHHIWRSVEVTTLI